ncbi:hypothetical protein MycrhDRAFT_6904 [Mycolicibacterium rhodesiae JS60]|nr:hypothetical protein MycrhDRAFT_6904 [Mycolicibacterium rhodesiae JS60]
MSENDDAVLTAAVGYAYYALPGTASPTPAQLKTIDLEKPQLWTATGWSSVGHTSRGTMPEFGYEGGEGEVKGSWQKKKLREISPDDPVDFLTMVLHQFDETGLGLYYGDNASSVAGEFGVASGTPTNEKAGLVIIEDGDLRLGFHFKRSSVKRDDAIELPIDDLAALPIRFTFLDYEDDPLLFKWINEDLFNVEDPTP